MPTGNPLAESQAREFARFVKSFWGIWAGLSATLFPLSAALFAVVPVPENFDRLYAVFGTVLSLFGMILVFVSRNDLWMRDLKARDFEAPLDRFAASIKAKACFSFAIGLMLFFIYLGYSALVWSYGPNRHNPALSVLLLFPYSLAFMSMAMAFSLLATAEYMRATVGGIAEAPGLIENSILKYFLRMERLQLSIVSKRSTSKGNLLFTLEDESGTRFEAEMTPKGKVVAWKKMGDDKQC
jgi:hypothetical protein